MPTLKLTNLTKYKAYFAAIAASHVAIDGFKWGDKEVVQNDSRSDMAERILWAQPYEAARYQDPGSDNITKVKEAKVAYLKVATSELFSDMDEDFIDCEEVIEDIIAKMIKDKRGAEVDGVWEMISVNIAGITTGPVDTIIGSTKYIGWEMKIPFHDNTNFAYDEAKWV